MRVHFFEEFPTPEHLASAAAIDFPSTVFLAAHHIDTFYQVAAQLRQINPSCEPAYWPLLGRSYWLSPFAEVSDILALREQLRSHQGERLKVLFDLELPLLHGRLLFGNAPRFFRNKRLIHELFEEFGEASHIHIHTAEYPAPFKLIQRAWTALGVSMPLGQATHSRIIMFYTSILRYPWLIRRVGQSIARLTQRRGERVQVGLGTIASGVFGNEPILSPVELQRDLTLSTQSGAQDVVIFRLGGLTEKYLQVIRPFVAGS